MSGNWGMGGGLYAQATMVLANGTDINDNVASLGSGMFWDVLKGNLSEVLASKNTSAEAIFGSSRNDLEMPVLCADIIDLTANN
jgi:hypothetical protein